MFLCVFAVAMSNILSYHMSLRSEFRFVMSVSHQTPGANPGTREGLAIPASYKTPTPLYSYSQYMLDTTMRKSCLIMFLCVFAVAMSNILSYHMSLRSEFRFVMSA
jgi:hypothetical protein